MMSTLTGSFILFVSTEEAILSASCVSSKSILLHIECVDCKRDDGDNGGDLSVEVFDFLVVGECTEGEAALYFGDFELV